MPAFVYVLQNERTSRHYIGSTTDLQRRLADHNRGNTSSTRNRGVWRLVYWEAYKDLGAARRREREIKSYKGGVQFKLLVKQAPPAERDCTG